MDYEGTIDYLYGLQKIGVKLGLEMPRRALELCGNPQSAFASIHVAGTNGKGSTCAMLAAMLEAAGQPTGLFTSPHLVSFTERMKVNGQEIEPDEVVALAGRIRALCEGQSTPTFFEVVTVMGFLHFQQQGARWAVVETGMGGRLDATNVLEPAVSVITPVGLDHKEFLGDTLAKVAYEKAGIIKPDTPVVIAPQEGEALDVLLDACRQMNAPASLYGRDFEARNITTSPEGTRFDYLSPTRKIDDLFVPLAGAYQAINGATAVRAFDLATGGAIDDSAIRRGLSATHWPGRLQFIPGEPPLVLDGAHNPHAAALLAQALKELYLKDARPMVLVLGIMADKDAAGIMAPLLPLAREVIFTAPDYGRAQRPEVLAHMAMGLGFAEPRVTSCVVEALGMARLLALNTGGFVVVTGSFYTLGEACEALGARGFWGNLRESMRNANTP